MPLAEIGTLLGMVAAVAAVLALAWVATRCLAGRLPAGTTAAPMGTGRLRLVERLPLGREEYLAVVRADERLLLLGVCSGQITLLKELTGEEAARWTAADARSAGAPSFREALHQVLQKKTKQEGADRDGSAGQCKRK